MKKVLPDNQVPEAMDPAIEEDKDGLVVLGGGTVVVDGIEIPGLDLEIPGVLLGVVTIAVEDRVVTGAHQVLVELTGDITYRFLCVHVLTVLAETLKT